MFKTSVRWRTAALLFATLLRVSSSDATQCFHRMETLGTDTGSFASTNCALQPVLLDQKSAEVTGLQDLDIFFEQVKNTCGVMCRQYEMLTSGVITESCTRLCTSNQECTEWMETERTKCLDEFRLAAGNSMLLGCSHKCCNYDLCNGDLLCNPRAPTPGTSHTCETTGDFSAKRGSSSSSSSSSSRQSSSHLFPWAAALAVLVLGASVDGASSTRRL